MTRRSDPNGPEDAARPPRSTGFPPRVGSRLRVLVLGSFPGERSLAAGEYYANPHNRFWRAMGEVTGVGAGDRYAARLDALLRAGIGLWDVLGACERPGSLDQAIRRGSEVPNDLGDLVAAHPELRAILLNGRSVATLFHRFIVPRDLWDDAGVAVLTLPSTSPAHAALPPEAVVRAWRATIRRFLPDR